MADELLNPTPEAIPEQELAEFLQGTWIARLSVLDMAGYPYVIPVWYEWDGHSFWIVARAHVHYVPFLQRDPRSAISVAEDAPPFRRVLARGKVTVVEGPASSGAWEAVLRRVARRYRGPGGEAYVDATRGIERYLLRLDVERMLSFRGFR